MLYLTLYSDIPQESWILHKSTTERRAQLVREDLISKGYIVTLVTYHSAYGYHIHYTREK